MKLTPNDIEVLIHYHVSGPESHPRSSVPAVRESIKMFLLLDMLEADENSFRTTPKGDAMVRALCNTPEPKMAYIDSHGNVL